MATLENLDARLCALDKALKELLEAIRVVEATQRVFADAMREFAMTRTTAEDTNARIRSIQERTDAINNHLIKASDS